MTINVAMTTTSEEGAVTTGSLTVNPTTGLVGDEEAAFWDYLWFHHAPIDEATGTRVARTPQNRAQTVRTWQRAMLRAELRRMVQFTRSVRARAAEDTVPDFSGKSDA